MSPGTPTFVIAIAVGVSLAGRGPGVLTLPPAALTPGAA